MRVNVRKKPPLDHLRKSLPRLPARLQEAGRFVVEHQFDVATRSMRDLAVAAGLQPASFTRLAQALGHSGWEEFRAGIVEAQRPEGVGPFSGRSGSRPSASAEASGSIAAATLVTDRAGLECIDADRITAAATTLHNSRRIWIAGFRSCRSVALLLHYQLRLFRPRDTYLVGATGAEDFDYSSFQRTDAVVVFGFQPYSNAGVQARIAANAAGCSLVAVADAPESPICDGADHVLLFESLATPAFFPSLVGAVAIAQALAASIFVRGGEPALVQLRKTEAMLAALSQYVPEKREKSAR